MPKPSSKAIPTFLEEKALINGGYTVVAGVDEVGRGPLAGPVMAGVAILPSNPKGSWVKLVRDSKQLTKAQREKALFHLQDVALGLEVGICSSQEVDALGIVEATKLAMSRAIDSLAVKPDFLLLDAITLQKVDLPQKSIIRGDALCLSIAAASIVAKVTRDRLMEQMDQEFPEYGFARNKGYGTREHMTKLKQMGPCPIHRYSFAPVREAAASQA